VSSFTAIRAVTDTIDRLLFLSLGIVTDRLTPPHQLSATTPLVSIYLYRVQTNPFMNNMDWQTVTSTQLRAPPIGLNLFYLITPYGSDQSQIQQITGEVLRAFHEQPVIRTGHPALHADLATMTEELRIVPHPLTLSESLDLWKSFGSTVAYRLALTYEVSAVIIDSQTTRDITRVAERVVDLSATL
jgi:hypothetical protein